MAYGRLDVFWPDGKFETYTLAQSTVSVGRSVGNTIMLDTDTISRYHFSIIEEDDEVFLTDMDSANGTFVDGVKIPSNERYPLRGGEEIQIGHLRMSYYTLQDAPTIPLATMPEDTQRIEKEDVNFKIDLQLPHIAVTPGSYTSVELLITNKGDKDQTFKVEVSGIPKEWVRINRPMLEIDRGEDGLVLINIKPTRHSDTKPGVYQTNVKVQIDDDPGSYVEAPMKVTILPFSGFGMALANRKIRMGERLTLHLHNQGSAPLSLQVGYHDLSDKLDVSVRPEKIHLEAGERQQAYIEARPKQQRIFGGQADYPIDVQVKATDLPHFMAASRGHYIDSPPLPAWGRYALTGMAGIAILLFLFGLFAILRTPPAQPEILAFAVNQGGSQIARGTTLVLDWTIENTDNLSVVVGDQTITFSEEVAESGTTQIETDELYGEIDVMLVASNDSGDNTATETRTVTIYDPVIIDNVTITPNPVVRDVVQTISINWEVSGAVDVQISGLENLVTVPPPIVNDSVQVVGIPESDFTVVLRVTDELGGITERTITVNLATPQCSAINIDTPLYAQPDQNASIVGTVTSGIPTPVNGIDPSGIWLRFILENGAIGWGEREAFACDTIFDVENLRTVVVATPTPDIQAPIFTVTPTVPIQVVPTATIPLTTTPTSSN